MNTAEELLNILLSPATRSQTFTSMAQWFHVFNQQVRRFELSLDRALLGGRLSENLSYAFAAGYQSAIEALFQPQALELSSFCVSESKGNHPRAIEARLTVEDGQLHLSGYKSFVSGAGDAQRLYIACLDQRIGHGLDAEGRPIIKVVSLAADQPGVEIESLPPLGFVPEVAHGKVRLNNVLLEPEALLPGDGYLNYVKAFRTYEDVHVLAAVTAYRLGEAIKARWPDQLVQSHLPIILGLRSLTQMDLQQPSAHIALAAVRSQLESLIQQTDSYFLKGNPEAFAAWQRDKVLLNVASKAHQKRTETAWKAFIGKD